MPTKMISRSFAIIVATVLTPIFLLFGCSHEVDPETYFNPATDTVKVKACIDKLKPMIEEIKSKKLDEGDYIPGSELTVKNMTFRYYQSLVRASDQLPIFLSWSTLTAAQKKSASYYYCPLAVGFTSHEDEIKKEIATAELLFKRKFSYQTADESREEGFKSRDEWDKIVRDDIPVRRKKLQAGALSHTMSNRHGVRIDTYMMRSGPSVVCSTTVHPTAGPNMNCDNEP